MNSLYDIFISYSRKDSEVVLPIVERLKAEGYRCWMDVDGIESGDEFKRVIVNAIKVSRIVVFFSSDSANASKYTVKEINVAVEMAKPIVPFRLDETPYADPILFDLSGLDFIMYDMPDGNSVARLLKGLSRLLKKEKRQEINDGYHKPVVPSYCSGEAYLAKVQQWVREAVKMAITTNIHCETTTAACVHVNGIGLLDSSAMYRLNKLEETIRKDDVVCGRYHIGRLLKYGGRSLVYSAFDNKRKEHVTLKILLATQNENDGVQGKPLSWLCRLFRLNGHASTLVTKQEEAFKVISDIRHPNVVKVHETFGGSNGLYYVVEDFIDGASLSDVFYRLKLPYSSKCISDAMLNRRCAVWCFLLHGIANGLDCLHAHGVIHCDVKPDNIMVSNEGTPMVTDYGDAKMMSDAKVFLPKKIDVLGVTPEYMTPEQCARAPLDGNTDQYSLAVMAYKIFFGNPPFSNNDFQELCSAIMFEPVSIPADANPKIGKCLLRALAKNKSDRFASCVDFVRTLTKAAMELHHCKELEALFCYMENEHERH